MISPISSVGSITSIAGPDATKSATGVDQGFASKVSKALEDTSSAERNADLLAQDVAAGGDTPIHELMIAQTKATLSVELLVQTRNRAIEAYQEVMRMQV